jgi:hypothetical protein
LYALPANLLRFHHEDQNEKKEKIMFKKFLGVGSLLSVLLVVIWGQALCEVRVNVQSPGTQQTAVTPNTNDNKGPVTLPQTVSPAPAADSDTKTQMQPLSRLVPAPLSAKITPEKLSMKSPGVLTVQGGTAPYTVTSSSGFLIIAASGPNTYQVTQTHNAAGAATLTVKDARGQVASVVVKMLLTINVK